MKSMKEVKSIKSLKEVKSPINKAFERNNFNDFVNISWL